EDRGHHISSEDPSNQFSWIIYHHFRVSLRKRPPSLTAWHFLVDVYRLYTYYKAMAINIHTDTEFERRIAWLSRHLKKTKTEVIKELVEERYHLRRSGFRFGGLKPSKKVSEKSVQEELKGLDRDRDLD